MKHASIVIITGFILGCILSIAQNYLPSILPFVIGYMMACMSGHVRQLQRLTAMTRPNCDMCGEPKDGRDHSGCDALPF